MKNMNKQNINTVLTDAMLAVIKAVPTGFKIAVILADPSDTVHCSHLICQLDNADAVRLLRDTADSIASGASAKEIVHVHSDNPHRRN